MIITNKPSFDLFVSGVVLNIHRPLIARIVCLSMFGDQRRLHLKRNYPSGSTFKAEATEETTMLTTTDQPLWQLLVIRSYLSISITVSPRGGFLQARRLGPMEISTLDFLTRDWRWNGCRSISTKYVHPTSYDNG